MLPLFLAAAVCFAIAACSDDDDDEIINENELPQAARTFVATYFPSARIMTSGKDNNEYEVTLSDGTRIDFNKSEEWTDVDAAYGREIPSGFYPGEIDTYISTNLSGSGINEISKEHRGYDVELINGKELLFNHNGAFIGYDID